MCYSPNEDYDKNKCKWTTISNNLNETNFNKISFICQLNIKTQILDRK